MSTLQTVGELATQLTGLLPAVDEPRFDPEDVKPGWLGFSVFLAMAAATALLLRSFVKQTRKVDFEEEPAGDAAERPVTDEPRDESAARDDASDRG